MEDLFLVDCSLEISPGMFKSILPYLDAYQSPGDIILRWMNSTPDARQTALVGSIPEWMKLHSEGTAGYLRLALRIEEPIM